MTMLRRTPTLLVMAGGFTCMVGHIFLKEEYEQ